MITGCGRCRIGHARCADCLITVAAGSGPDGELGPAEIRALRVLADAGLVRLQPRGPAWSIPATKAS